MSAERLAAGHAFLSYVREDSDAVDRLQRVLEGAGIPVWRDTEELWPGEDWRARIRSAVTDNALVFIACFSKISVIRERSYQNEELLLAIDQLRQRRPNDPWLIPVRLDDCVIPDLDIGGGRALASIQRADLFGDSEHEGSERLVAAVLRILSRRSDVAAAMPTRPAVQAEIAASSGMDGGTPDATAGVASGSAGPVMLSGAPDRAAAMDGQADTGSAVTNRWRPVMATLAGAALAASAVYGGVVLSRAHQVPVSSFTSSGACRFLSAARVAQEAQPPVSWVQSFKNAGGNPECDYDSAKDNCCVLGLVVTSHSAHAALNHWLTAVDILSGPGLTIPPVSGIGGRAYWYGPGQSLAVLKGNTFISVTLGNVSPAIMANPSRDKALVSQFAREIISRL